MSTFKPGDLVESLHPKLDLGGAVTVEAIHPSGCLSLHGSNYLVDPRDVRHACQPECANAVNFPGAYAGPMTATEARIRARNEVTPFFDPPPLEIQEYHAKWIQDLVAAAGIKPSELSPLLRVKPEVMKEMYPQDIQPGVVIAYDEDPPDSGWMPAGTYMPIQYDDVMTFKYAKPKLAPQERRNGFFLEKCPKDGNASTLAAKNLSKPRFPERTRLTTRSWDPGYGDLEDAE